MFKRILSAGRTAATATGTPLYRRRSVQVVGATAAAAAVTMLAAGPAAATTSTQILSGNTFSLGSLLLPSDNGPQLWISDHLQGLCRVDPSGPNGALAINPTTCALFFGKSAIKPGQLSYDAANHEIYVPDLAAKSLGVLRIGYNTAGSGSLSLFDRTQLVSNCGSVAGALPWGSALGPDGDLYIVGKKSPNILRLHNPSTLGSVSANCGADVQNIGNVADSKKGFQLAFLGHDLWETDGFAMGVIQDAVAKARPGGTTIVDGGQTRTFATATPPQNATTQFVGVAPTGTALQSDGVSHLWVGNNTSVTAITVSGQGASFAVEATGFQFVSSITVDPSVNGANGPDLIVADDTSNGTFISTGRMWRVHP